MRISIPTALAGAAIALAVGSIGGVSFAIDDDPLPDANRVPSLASHVILGRTVDAQAKRIATLERQMRLVQDRAAEATNFTRCVRSVLPTMVDADGKLTVPAGSEQPEFYLIKLLPRCVGQGTWLS
jgi:hypothetical protein